MTGRKAGPPVVAFVVNGEPTSPLAGRAEAFAARLSARLDIRILTRRSGRLLSGVRFLFALMRVDPALVYVFDLGIAGVAAALTWQTARRARLVVETGDPLVELVRSTGARGPIGQALTRVLEAAAFRFADRVVVRGRGHAAMLRQRDVTASVIPDGVDCARFVARDAATLRQELGLGHCLTVGVLGSAVWSERLGICYGWELVEALRLLADQPVKGVLIGDGSGMPKLRERARSYGIEDRLVFVGRQPYEQLPRYLSALDVCLSTQTDDPVGQARTTGKLPLYLAAGRFVLATRVGEAAQVLDDEMLLPYHGTVDRDYPVRLAGRLRELLRDRSALERARVRSPEIARLHFDYDVLAPRVARLVEEALGE